MHADESLEDYIKANHFYRYRELPDGRALTVQVRLYNTILTIGPARANFYDDHW